MPDDPSTSRGVRGCAGPLLASGCGCLLLVGAVVIAGLVWMGGTIADIARQRNELISQALANGDAAAAYESADESFRARYTLDQLANYLAQHPAVLDPPAWSASINSHTVNNQTFVSTTFESSGRRYTVYAVKGNDVMRLLGISPELDDAVPSLFQGDAGNDPAAGVDDDLGLEF